MEGLLKKDEHRTSNVQVSEDSDIELWMGKDKETELSSWRKAPEETQYSFPAKDGDFDIPLVHYFPAKRWDEAKRTKFDICDD